MKIIKLTSGHEAYVDDEDYEIVSRLSWNLVSKDQHKYACYNRTLLMHRLIMSVKSSTLRVDHIDNNGLNNQKSNLRVCTQAQNIQGARLRIQIRPKTSRFKGVYWYKSRQCWHVRVGRKHVGYYTDEVDAARAYDVVAKDVFGEFAMTNQMMGLLSDETV